MKKQQTGHKCTRSLRTIDATLFKKPLTGWLKQVRMRGVINAASGRTSKACQVIIGLYAHHHDFMDVEMIINASKTGLTLILPKKSLWSNFQLQKVYKKPCGSLEVQFEFQQKRVHRRERPLEPHQALIGMTECMVKDSQPSRKEMPARCKSTAMKL